MKKIIYLLSIIILITSTEALAFNKADLNKFLRLNACPGCDLSQAPLSDKDFNRAKLAGPICGGRISITPLCGWLICLESTCGTPIFPGLFLRRRISIRRICGVPTIQGAVFDGAYLSKARLAQGIKPAKPTAAQTVKKTAEKPKAHKAVVKKSAAAAIAKVVKTAPAPVDRKKMLEQALDRRICVECDFSGMDLSDVNFKESFLERCDFEGANLQDANFKYADLKGANFRNANLTDAYLKGADLYNANLAGANLKGADLKNAALDGAYLAGSTLARQAAKDK